MSIFDNISKYIETPSINEATDKSDILLRFIEKQLEPALKMMKRELKLSDMDSLKEQFEYFKEMVDEFEQRMNKIK